MSSPSKPKRARPKYLELEVSIGLLVVTAAVAFGLWHYLGSSSTGIIVGVPLGILSGVLLLFVVYFSQLPRLVIDITGDKYDPTSTSTICT
jgi:ABC-type cobalamin transport system permease subunit